MDPQRQALVELDALLARARRRPLSAGECQRSVDLLALVPGWAGRVARTLADQRNAAAVDALLTLPPTLPGLIEGLHAAIAAGVRRVRTDGQPFPALLALDFRNSRARGFPDLLARARAAFRETFEQLVIDGRVHYRVSIREGRGTLAGRASALAPDVSWLHARLARLRGTRTWLNGWCMPVDGPLGAGAQVHFVRAWLSWAAGRVETKGAGA